jgi:hypothetical protein
MNSQDSAYINYPGSPPRMLEEAALDADILVGHGAGQISRAQITRRKSRLIMSGRY